MKTIGDRLEQLETIVENLEHRLFNLEQQVGIWPVPDTIVPVEEISNKCPNCAIVWDGVMGYCCNRTDCPYSVSSTSFPQG